MLCANTHKYTNTYTHICIYSYIRQPNAFEYCVVIYRLWIRTEESTPIKNIELHAFFGFPVCSRDKIYKSYRKRYIRKKHFVCFLSYDLLLTTAHTNTLVRSLSCKHFSGKKAHINKIVVRLYVIEYFIVSYFTYFLVFSLSLIECVYGL